MSRLPGSIDLTAIADWHAVKAVAAKSQATNAFEAATTAAEPHDAADIAARASMLNRARTFCADAIDHARMATTLRAVASLRHG